MNLFVSEELTNACRNQDKSKVETLGPYAQALFFIVNGAEFKRSAQPTALPRNEDTYLYRGVKLSSDQVEEMKSFVGKSLHLRGFMSVTRNKDTALDFLNENPGPGEYKALIEMKYRSTGFMHFRMTNDYTLFPEEQEILLQDGAYFKVKEVSKTHEREDEVQKIILECALGW